MDYKVGMTQATSTKVIGIKACQIMDFLVDQVSGYDNVNL